MDSWNLSNVLTRIKGTSISGDVSPLVVYAQGKHFYTHVIRKDGGGGK